MIFVQFIKLLKKLIQTIFQFIKFYLARPKNQPLLVSMPRSGTHLTLGLLNVCFSMKEGFPGEIAINDKNYASYASLEKPLDERSIYNTYEFPQIWHSHLSYNEIIPLRKKYCKTIVLIREPINGIKSYITHTLNAQKITQYFENEIGINEFLKLEKKFMWVSHYAKFLSSWRKRKENNLKYPVIILDLSFIKENNLKYLKFINKFYSYNFSEEQIKKAVKQLDLKRVEKLSSNQSVRISKSNVILSQEVINYIKAKCEKDYLQMKYNVDHDLI